MLLAKNAGSIFTKIINLTYILDIRHHCVIVSHKYERMSSNTSLLVKGHPLLSVSRPPLCVICFGGLYYSMKKLLLLRDKDS